MKKEIIEKFNHLKEYKNIDLRWIKIEIVNNKPTPIITTNILLKWWWLRIKVLLYLATLIAKNKPKDIESIVSYLEKSEIKKIEILKIINNECKREPLLKKIITSKTFPYRIESLEKEIEKDIFLKKNEKWELVNILFDFIKKVSNLTNFNFSEKSPKTIWLNISITKKFLKDNKLSLEELEWFFDKVYSVYIYDWYNHKSIRWFLLEAEDYFLNTNEIQSIIKALLIYMKIKWLKKTPLSIWMEYKKNKDLILSILKQIWFNIDNFNKIINDFSDKYKYKWLNWTLNTLFKNLYNDYSKYIILDNTKKEDNEKEKYKEKDFMILIKEKNIKDNDIIKQLYNIYKEKWINWVKKVI